MTCPKCGGKVTFHASDAHIKIEGTTVHVDVVGVCEFCDHVVTGEIEEEITI